MRFSVIRQPGFGGSRSSPSNRLDRTVRGGLTGRDPVRRLVTFVAGWRETRRSSLSSASVTQAPDQSADFDVLGIGNALVDVLSTEGHEFITDMELTKSSMTLIETDRAEKLYAAMGDKTEMSGGSAANTLAGVASFGGRAAYIGRIRDDELGTAFAHDMNTLGVHFDSPRALDGDPTGRCLIIVTPDGERTMNTYLGASAALSADHLDTDLITRSKITFLEG